MKNFFLFIGVIALFTACTGQVQDTNKTQETMENKLMIPEIQQNEVFAGINLTVAEGKRLIAKRIAHHPQVKERLQKGMVIITSGTTNTYIAEELANLNAPHGSLMTGNFIPQNRKNIAEGLTRVPNIVLIDGQQVNMDYEEALQQMQEGDIVFKGANLLNYAKQQVAVCIGAPDGGTTARIRKAEKAHLIVPIGLEKETSGDLYAYEKLFENTNERISYVSRVWVHHNAEIFTEIEAVKTIASVNVVPFGTGGIAGREGGISLAVYGAKEEVQKVLDFVTTIQGEKPFVE